LHLRVLVPALLLLVGLLAAAGAPAQADGGTLTGTWTWTYPNVVVPFPDGPSALTVGGSSEQGTLSLRGGATEWTVELPSAIVGCAAGKPQYAPKVGQTALLQTYPDGSCILYFVNNGHYEPYWYGGKSAAGLTVGPAWGTGDFR
jgi:hypothetical protein